MRKPTRRMRFCTAAVILLAISTLATRPGWAQQADRRAQPVVAPPSLPPPPAPALYNLDDAYLEWNLSP